jgi:ApaG protein
MRGGTAASIFLGLGLCFGTVTELASAFLGGSGACPVLRERRAFSKCSRPPGPSGSGQRSQRGGRRLGEILRVEMSSSSEGLGGSGSSADEQAVKLPEIVPPEMPSETEREAIWGEIEELERQIAELGDGASTEELDAKVVDLKAKDPYFSLKESFDAASENGDFFTAAKLRLTLDKVGVPKSQSSKEKALPKLPSEPAMAGRGGEGSNTMRFTPSSEATTAGLRIEVKSHYYPEQSNPSAFQYVFTYSVKIFNGSDETMQLASRTWRIKSACPDEKEQLVQGPGVVGQQPVLEPGQSFEYTSACPIRCGPKGGHPRVVGRMEGSFLMVSGARGEIGFEATISPFFLILPPGVREGNDDGDNGSLIEQLGL